MKNLRRVTITQHDPKSISVFAVVSAILYVLPMSRISTTSDLISSCGVSAFGNYLHNHRFVLFYHSHIHDSTFRLNSSKRKDSMNTPYEEEEDLFQRTKRQYQKLKQMEVNSYSHNNDHDEDNDNDDLDNSVSGSSTSRINLHLQKETEILYQQLIALPANKLKEQLQSLRLDTKGRKPDLAQRLARHITIQNSLQEKQQEEEQNQTSKSDTYSENNIKTTQSNNKINKGKTIKPLKSFANIPISIHAGTAFAKANFIHPTPIQIAALPLLMQQNQSLILHAETGSGKTITYLLPITEFIWKQQQQPQNPIDGTKKYALILTPTRELAAQVAGVASILAPPNTVRLVTTPTNLVRDSYEYKEKSQGADHTTNNNTNFKIIVASAKSIMISLFGDGTKMPAPPTSKPEAQTFLQNVQYLVLDEVDKLLNIQAKSSRANKSKYYKQHEKPAAILTSSIARFTLGQVQLVAASATVGRPLKRELSRVLGLLPNECPTVIRGCTSDISSINDSHSLAMEKDDGNTMTKRAITLPKGLTHYVYPCDGSTNGNLLTSAAFLLQNISKRTKEMDGKEQRILLVITKSCGLSMQNSLGALQHFNISPKPQSLLDLLTSTSSSGVGSQKNVIDGIGFASSGSDELIEMHRVVSKSTGLGESILTNKNDVIDNLNNGNDDGYILVVGEDSIRGLHLDSLDTVLIVGRPVGPDEYIHIAGRAGRAGKKGNVITIVGYEQTPVLTSWQSMLEVGFNPVEEGDVPWIE